MEQSVKMDCWGKAIFGADMIARVGGNLLLYGPPGTGKSYFAMWHAQTSSMEAEMCNCTEDMGFYRIEGTDRIVNGSFQFCAGPATRAWQSGARLVINEIEKTSADVLSGLLGVLDGKEVASVLLPDGTKLKPAKGFHCIATSNCENPSELPEALADRFGYKVKIDQPHPEIMSKWPASIRELAQKTWNLPGARRRSVRQWETLVKGAEYIRTHGLALAGDKTMFAQLVHTVFQEGADEVLNAIFVTQAANGEASREVI